MTTPPHTARIKAVVPTATKPTPPTPAAPKPPLRDRLARLLPGFNVNSVLLLILIAMVVIHAWGGQPEYRYDVINIDREKVAHGKKWHSNMAKRGVESTALDFIPKGWEYVGPLCNDGINSSWILIRRPK